MARVTTLPAVQYACLQRVLIVGQQHHLRALQPQPRIDRNSGFIDYRRLTASLPRLRSPEPKLPTLDTTQPGSHSLMKSAMRLGQPLQPIIFSPADYRSARINDVARSGFGARYIDALRWLAEYRLGLRAFLWSGNPDYVKDRNTAVFRITTRRSLTRHYTRDRDRGLSDNRVW